MSMNMENSIVPFAEELSDDNLENLFGGCGCGFICSYTGECTCTNGASICRACYVDEIS
jgi:hypothetical protein